MLFYLKNKKESKEGETYVLPKKTADEDEDEEEEEENEDEKKKQLLSQKHIKFYDSGADRRNARRSGGERECFITMNFFKEIPKRNLYLRVWGLAFIFNTKNK